MPKLYFLPHNVCVRVKEENIFQSRRWVPYWCCYSCMLKGKEKERGRNKKCSVFIAPKQRHLRLLGKPAGGNNTHCTKRYKRRECKPSFSFFSLQPQDAIVKRRILFRETTYGELVVSRNHVAHEINIYCSLFSGLCCFAYRYN